MYVATCISSMMEASKKVCVIGAGPCGLGALKAFKTAAANGVKIPQVICYEKQGEIGGLWNYSWRTGVDDNGEAVHNGMYKYLWSNGPKEALEFANYSFEEHFGKPIPSYPPREILFDYVKGCADKFSVREWVKLNTVVQRVTYDPATSIFTVVSNCKGTKIVETFNYVIVATGHFSTPNAPEWPGFNQFNGRILHAHDFRDAKEFSGKDILLIGASYSAEDIAIQCYKYGVNSVTLSWRTKPMSFDWPEAITTVPLLTHVEGSTCFFKDGSSKKLDVIILCTGYKHHFPFMEESLTLRTVNRMWCDQLYKGIFLHNNPKVMYLGMQDQYFTFNMFDTQAWYARDYILGKIKLPSANEMKAQFDEWRAREEKLNGAKDEIHFQADYVANLLEETDYPMTFVREAEQLFIDWKKLKQEGILTYRDQAHRSPVTGTMAPVHHTPWVKAMDDSMATYLSN